VKADGRGRFEDRAIRILELLAIGARPGEVCSILRCSHAEVVRVTQRLAKHGLDSIMLRRAVEAALRRAGTSVREQVEIMLAASPELGSKGGAA
jgi:hypothetical protein